jgi:hypothetical protein
VLGQKQSGQAGVEAVPVDAFVSPASFQRHALDPATKAE